ncbi:hypothetical protein Ancab_020360 [Ancistrocladus abbreviatus]
MEATLNLKEMALESKRACKSNGSQWGKVLELHQQSKRKLMRVKTKRILMKRRATQEGSRRRHVDRIEEKVRILKKLIPNTNSGGLEGLFRDAANYIMSLQMRVRVMQIMVDALSGPC